MELIILHIKTNHGRRYRREYFHFYNNSEKIGAPLLVHTFFWTFFRSVHSIKHKQKDRQKAVFLLGGEWAREEAAVR